MVGALRFAHPTKKLPRRALGQNPLQGAAVHVEPPGGFGDGAATEHAPPHLAADPGETRTAVVCGEL